MNNWQLTGVIITEPEFEPSTAESNIEVMSFTLKNVEKDGEGRKRAVFVSCWWPNPDAQARKLFRSRALVQVEGYGFLTKVTFEGRSSFTMAMIVETGVYNREMAEISVQR